MHTKFVADERGNVGKDVFARVYSAPNRAKLYQCIVDDNRLVACLAGSFGAQISVCNPLDCAENVAVYAAILAADLEHFSQLRVRKHTTFIFARARGWQALIGGKRWQTIPKYAQKRFGMQINTTYPKNVKSKNIKYMNKNYQNYQLTIDGIPIQEIDNGNEYAALVLLHKSLNKYLENLDSSLCEKEVVIKADEEVIESFKIEYDFNKNKWAPKQENTGS